MASLFISALIAVQNASGYLSDVDGIDHELDKRSGQALVAVWGVFNILYAIRWWYIRHFCRLLRRPVALLRSEGIRYLSPHGFMKSIPVWKRLFGAREGSALTRESSSGANTFFSADNQTRIAPASF